MQDNSLIHLFYTADYYVCDTMLQITTKCGPTVIIYHMHAPKDLTSKSLFTHIILWLWQDGLKLVAKYMVYKMHYQRELHVLALF